MTDTHCHIISNKDEPWIERAIHAGVGKIVLAGTTIEDSFYNMQLARQYPETVFAAVGIHPNYADSQDVARLESLLSEAVAVGEAGIDLFGEKPVPLETQVNVLEAQIALALEHALPFIVHTRNAFQETYEILSKYTNLAAVIHCFTGNAEEADAWLSLGFHLSVTGIITYPSAETVRQALARVPLERLMLETDSPYLAPQQLRGKSNEPANLIHIAQMVSESIGQDVETVIKETDRTAAAFFKFKMNDGA